MTYSEIVDTGVTRMEAKVSPVGSEHVTVTIRAPRNPRDAARKVAEPRGLCLTACARTRLAKRVSEGCLA